MTETKFVGHKYGDKPQYRCISVADEHKGLFIVGDIVETDGWKPNGDYSASPSSVHVIGHVNMKPPDEWLHEITL